MSPPPDAAEDAAVAPDAGEPDAGACASPLECVVRCQVLTSRVIASGERYGLQAIAFDRGHRVIPGVPFTWSSSDVTAATVTGTVATGVVCLGPCPGARSSTITARVAGRPIDCSARLPVSSHGFGEGTSDSISVVRAEDGTPIQGATVYLTFSPSDGVIEHRGVPTDRNGRALFTAVPSPFGYTAVAPGRKAVSIRSSRTVVPLPLADDPRAAHEAFGAVDLSASPRADVRAAVVGRALPRSLAGGRMGALAGDGIATVFDAPELGLANQRRTLPGGFLLALGMRRFTEEATRCRGVTPGMDSVGCYSLPTPPGAFAAEWTFGGRLSLAQIAPVVARLGALQGTEPIPPERLLVELAPSMRSLHHGVRFGFEVSGPPGSFDLPLAAEAPLSVHSAVAVPDLPSLPGGGFSATAVLVTGAVVPSLGLVPLGITAAPDVRGSEAPDGRVAGEERPSAAPRRRCRTG